MLNQIFRLNVGSVGLAGLVIGFATTSTFAQTEIIITGGTVTTGSSSGLYITYGDPISGTIETSQQGSLSFTTSAYLATCCGETLALTVSGTGYTPNGPYAFSNVPTFVVFNEYMALGTAKIFPGTFTIASGAFNSGSAVSYLEDSGFSAITITDVDVSDPTAFSFNTFSSPELPISNDSFDLENYSDEPNAGEPTSLTTLGNANLGNSPNTPADFRSKGIHTRIMPIWTPGLYQ